MKPLIAVAASTTVCLALSSLPSVVRFLRGFRKETNEDEHETSFMLHELPDDILSWTLSRMPLKKVYEMRQVCAQLRERLNSNMLKTMSRYNLLLLNQSYDSSIIPGFLMVHETAPMEYCISVCDGNGYVQRIPATHFNCVQAVSGNGLYLVISDVEMKVKWWILNPSSGGEREISCIPGPSDCTRSCALFDEPDKSNVTIVVARQSTYIDVYCTRSRVWTTHILSHASKAMLKVSCSPNESLFVFAWGRLFWLFEGLDNHNYTDSCRLGIMDMGRMKFTTLNLPHCSCGGGGSCGKWSLKGYHGKPILVHDTLPFGSLVCWTLELAERGNGFVWQRRKFAFMSVVKNLSRSNKGMEFLVLRNEWFVTYFNQKKYGLLHMYDNKGRLVRSYSQCQIKNSLEIWPLETNCIWWPNLSET